MSKLVIGHFKNEKVRRERMPMLSWEDSISSPHSWRGLLHLAQRVRRSYPAVWGKGSPLGAHFVVPSLMQHGLLRSIINAV